MALHAPMQVRTLFPAELTYFPLTVFTVYLSPTKVFECPTRWIGFSYDLWIISLLIYRQIINPRDYNLNCLDSRDCVIPIKHLLVIVPKSLTYSLVIIDERYESCSLTSISGSGGPYLDTASVVSYIQVLTGQVQVACLPFDVRSLERYDIFFLLFVPYGACKCRCHPLFHRRFRLLFPISVWVFNV